MKSLFVLLISAALGLAITGNANVNARAAAERAAAEVHGAIQAAVSENAGVQVELPVLLKGQVHAGIGSAEDDDENGCSRSHRRDCDHKKGKGSADDEEKQIRVDTSLKTESAIELEADDPDVEIASKVETALESALSNESKANKELEIGADVDIKANAATKTEAEVTDSLKNELKGTINLGGNVGLATNGK